MKRENVKKAYQLNEEIETLEKRLEEARNKDFDMGIDIRNRITQYISSPTLAVIRTIVINEMEDHLRNLKNQLEALD